MNNLLYYNIALVTSFTRKNWNVQKNDLESDIQLHRGSTNRTISSNLEWYTCVADTIPINVDFTKFLFKIISL